MDIGFITEGGYRVEDNKAQQSSTRYNRIRKLGHFNMTEKAKQSWKNEGGRKNHE